MSVCSDGAVTLGAGQVRGQARYPGVEMSTKLLRQMTRTRGVMTTFSVFCARTMGKPIPIVQGHKVNRALTPTCEKLRVGGSLNRDHHQARNSHS